MMNDFLLSDENELLFENGDLVLGDGRLQRVRLRLKIAQGNLKHAPLVGANILTRINGPASTLETVVRREMEAEGVDYNLLVRG
jgi:hypothetical protein